MIFPFQEYWSHLREGTRDQIIGGTVVLIIGAIAGLIWRNIRSQAPKQVDIQPISISPTPPQVVLKIDGMQPITKPEAEIPSGSARVARSPIPRPPLAGFVARTDESGRNIIERLKEELAPEKEQLIVLWGAGGVGKTTLAAETARAIRDVFVGGIVWTTADGKPGFGLSTLLDEIATQLGQPDLRQLAPDPKDEAIHQLLLAAPTTLIVLDNFETISPNEQERCAGWLATRASCPALITSREQVVQARPIRILAMSLLEAQEFLQRLISQLGNPQDFANLDHERIIQSADRIPQVLQWVVKQIGLARQPQAVLDELLHGEGNAAKRVFDRSFDLPQLGDDGRAALLALSLFVGSASRPALAEVAGFGSDIARLDLAVQKLVELWLIQAMAGNERLRLEGLTREFTKAHLVKDGSENIYRHRFVAYFVNYVCTYSEAKPDSFDALERERENVLNAVDLAFEIGDWNSVHSLAFGVAKPVDSFLSVRGHWADAVKANQQALEAARRSKSQGGIAAFAHNLAVMHMFRGELKEASLLYNESLELAQRLEDETGIARTLHQLGRVAEEEGDLAKARTLYEESLEIERKLGNLNGIATSLHQLAIVTHLEFKLPEARRLYNESLEIKRKLDNQTGIANTVHQLAILAHQEHRFSEARGLYEESLEIARKWGDQSSTAVSLAMLGRLAEDEGNLTEAAHLYEQAMEILEKLKSPTAKFARIDLERVTRKRVSSS